MTAFSRAWSSVYATRATQRHRAWLKRMARRDARRAVKRAIVKCAFESAELLAVPRHDPWDIK